MISHFSSNEPLQEFRNNLPPSFPALRSCSHYCFHISILTMTTSMPTSLVKTSFQQTQFRYGFVYQTFVIEINCVLFCSSGKALLDVLILGSVEQSPPVKDLLPLLGALKHMCCWHAAKITVITQNVSGWEILQTPLFLSFLPPTRGQWKHTDLYLLRSPEAKEVYLKHISYRSFDI